jgi:hypothetical protein
MAVEEEQTEPRMNANMKIAYFEVQKPGCEPL